MTKTRTSEQRRAERARDAQRNYAMVVIHADADRADAVIVQARPFTLEQMQCGCGGCVQEVPYFTRYGGRLRGRAYAWEEGKVFNAPPNHAATRAWRGILPQCTDYLVGDVIFLCRTDEEVTS